MASSSFPFHPSSDRRHALSRASELWGIEQTYWDIFGKQHAASDDVKAAILGSLGIDAGSAETLDCAAESRLEEEWMRPLPPSIVTGPVPSVHASLPETAAAGSALVRVRLEFGADLETRFELADCAVASRVETPAGRFVRVVLPLPEGVPLGYHELNLDIPAHSVHAASRLIVCPEKAWLPPGGSAHRSAGVGLSLYSLRSARNQGCGDFTDLMRFADWAVNALGAAFIALNPLHAIPNRTPYNTSPYLPDCSYYRNFIYIDIEDIPEFARSPWAQAVFHSEPVQREIVCLRESETVNYERVSHLKLGLLRLAFREFLREYESGSERARSFQSYVAREGELLYRFAVHSALDEAIHREHPDVWNWDSWPEPYRCYDSPETREFARTHQRAVMFFQYVQWIADAQLARAQAHARSRGMSIGLYHDLALATDRFGADVWMAPGFYIRGCRVGAPPDDFSPNGQDWSFPPPDSDAHFEDGYRLFSESIRKACQHGGALRIDHVMRFFHLYWIPDGMDASQGTYVKDRYEDLIHILALESERNRAIIVGEDLGTVPDYVRETLERFDILSYRLFYFEQDRNRQFRLPSQYPGLALVSASTHDLPTLAGFWLNRDIEARRAAGVINGHEAYRRALEDRMREKQKMLDILHRLNLLPPDFVRNAADVSELSGELHNAITGFLMCTPSMLLLLNQEDLFKETEQQNLPGTTAEYPNWQRRMKYAIEELETRPASDYAAMYRTWAERTGRL